MVVLAVEFLFLVFGVGAAWAVMSWRVKALEASVASHLAGADSVKEDLTIVKVYLRILLAKNGIDVPDDL